MNRNFRTLLKAREFKNKNVDWLESRVNELERIDLRELVNRELDACEIVQYGDIEDFVTEDRVYDLAMDAVRDEGYVRDDDVDDKIDEALDGYSDVSSWAENMDVVFYDDGLASYIDDRLERYEEIVSDKVEDAIFDHDFTDDVDSVINTYDFDLVMENTHLAAMVKDLTLRVRMLEVLAGLQSVKE